MTWLPPERDGERRVRRRDLLALTDPRRPWPPLQRLDRPARPRPRARDRRRAGAPRGDLRGASSERGRRRQGRERLRGVRRAPGDARLRARRARADRRPLQGARAWSPSRSPRRRASASELGELAETLDRPFDDVLADADELPARSSATVQSPLAIDAFRAVMRPAARAAPGRCSADAEELERLRELNTQPRAGLPALRTAPTSTRSCWPRSCTTHDFPRNHLLGGDNMSFWPIGPLGKRAGRDLHPPPASATTRSTSSPCASYFGHLVAKRFNLEWYIEGGRTRTGKLRPPKLGLLHYLVARARGRPGRGRAARADVDQSTTARARSAR